MEEIKEEKSKWSVTSWSVFLEGVLYICQAKMLFCSQNCSLFIRIQSLLFKLLDGKEKKELTCTLSGKARSKLMLD